MAKIEKGANFNRATVNRARGRVYYQDDGNGNTIAKKWPHGNKNTQTPNQKEWVDNFTTSAKLWKDAGGCTVGVAEALANQPFAPNFFPRDIFSQAFNGTHIDYVGNGEVEDRRGQEGEYGSIGAFRVTTPTALLSRSTAEALTNSTNKTLTPDTVVWDNNHFWEPADGEWMTFRSKGLYLIGAEVQYNFVTAGNTRQTTLVMPGGVNLARQFINQTTSAGVCSNLSILRYFDAGDQLAVWAYANGNGCTAQLRAIWAVGIVPEMIQ